MSAARYESGHAIADSQAEEIAIGAVLAGTGWPVLEHRVGNRVVAALTPAHFTDWRRRAWRAIQRQALGHGSVIIIADRPLRDRIASDSMVSVDVLWDLAIARADWIGLALYDARERLEHAHRRRVLRLLGEELIVLAERAA